MSADRYHDMTPEQAVVTLLLQNGMTLTTVESCTGGMVASRVVGVPGASEVLMQGLVTYSEQAKMTYAGVKEETLERYTAVSRETAFEMAAGAVRKTGTDCAVSTTGYAGPGGGTAEHPVGTVFVGVCAAGRVSVEEYHFEGDRQSVREQACSRALELLCDRLKEL